MNYDLMQIVATEHQNMLLEEAEHDEFARLAAADTTWTPRVLANARRAVAALLPHSGWRMLQPEEGRPIP
jgi:hypothetical protein